MKQSTKNKASEKRRKIREHLGKLPLKQWLEQGEISDAERSE